MKILIESILPILVLLPLTIFFIKDKGKIKSIGLFSLIFILYQIVLKLPTEISELQIIHSKWNWTGKLFAIIFGVLTYLLLRKRLIPFDFIHFRQDLKSLKKTFLMSCVPICIAIFSYFDTSKQFDKETLLFQLTMPGIDEEIMFRAILLGLLLSCFKDKIIIRNINLGNPSILFIGLLFGVVHGLAITDNYKLTFELSPFIWTFFYGFIWSWITIKSKSILQPIISHNMSNFLQNIIRMTK